jgi:hypothetical protein
LLKLQGGVDTTEPSTKNQTSRFPIKHYKDFPIDPSC